MKTITRSDIDPAEWAKHADGCMTCNKYRRPRGVTRWLDGRTKPARAGWYERLFTDGVFRHYWNGKVWAALRNGQPHWRQVGDYPCWRGLTCTAFMSPSRYPVARALETIIRDDTEYVLRSDAEAAIQAAVEQANARQNAAWRLMCAKMVAAERERCASAAWNHYMDTCRQKSISPASAEDWNAAGSVRRPTAPGPAP